MAHAVPNLHLGDALIHEILPCEVEGVGKVVHLLVGQQCVVSLHLNDGGGPVQRPILVGTRPFKTVFVQQLLYQLHCAVLELVKIAYFIVFGHVAHFGKVLQCALLHLHVLVLFLLPLLDALDLLLNDWITNDHFATRPRLEAQSLSHAHYFPARHRHLPALRLFRCMRSGFRLVGRQRPQFPSFRVDDLDELVQLVVALGLFLNHVSLSAINNKVINQLGHRR
jgi:hypothetical protein